VRIQKQQDPQHHDAKKAQIALRAYFNMAHQWQLNNTQQIKLLGEPSKATFFRWKKGDVKDISKDTFERISYLLGIFKALHILFTTPEQANTWLHRDNQAGLFAGRSALEFMLQGKMINLFETRKYLDAQRGGF
jgi:uncharacterized protein (DUF2384 family)